MTIKAHFDGKVLVPDEPLDIPTGEPLVVYVAKAASCNWASSENGGGSARDLLNSPLIGMWKHRNEIGDSVEFARKLRRVSERRQDVTG